MRSPKVLISLLIIVIIGLHAVPVLSYQGNLQTRWPFLAWAMYAAAQPPGPIETVNRRIIGVTTTGASEIITPESVGLGQPAFLKSYIRSFSLGDAAAAHRLAALANQRRSDPFVELRLEGEKFTLVDTGVVETKLPVKAYPVGDAAPVPAPAPATK
jgi:hypothetical protein